MAVAHDLLPDDVRKTIPPLYAQDGKGDEAVVHLRLFYPAGSYTGLFTEASYDEDEGDWRLFGKATMGHEWEWGYSSLNELQGVEVRHLRIERDLHFTPCTMADALEDKAVPYRESVILRFQHLTDEEMEALTIPAADRRLVHPKWDELYRKDPDPAWKPPVTFLWEWSRRRAG